MKTGMLSDRPENGDYGRGRMVISSMRAGYPNIICNHSPVILWKKQHRRASSGGSGPVLPGSNAERKTKAM